MIFLGDQPPPGHPVVLSREVWPQARSLEGDTGFGALAEAAVIEVASDNPDVDTPADLHALEDPSR